MLLCLGLDFKRGGFVDRALEAFSEVLRLDPQNHYALVNLQKLHEEQHQWQEAWEIRQRLGKLGTAAEDAAQPGDSRVPRERARPARRSSSGTTARRPRHFEAAIDLDPDDRARPT